MKIVYSWLKDFVDIDIPVEELADALTAAGLEVASIEKFKIPDGIKVAKILEREKHPGADKLSVCKVDAGGPEPLTVVCGAPNARAGLITALATIGTVLGPDFKISKAKLRGVESFGMLCSQKELGISEEHSGIIELPQDYKVGEALSVYYPEDSVIEIEITPDRGDCLSVLGVAREVAARFGLPLKKTSLFPVEKSDDPIGNAISVSIEAPSGCPRYMGRLIRGVKIAPSEEWMQKRLIKAGLRPINNIVDVTNYILLHFGQPMHAFDYNCIADKRIRVKKAETEQVFKTLDDAERKLFGGDLLICDGSRPVALAGIMGGAGSEITESTQDVFLECAYFDPVTVRKTSKRLGLSTDSSYRFERGVDPAEGLSDSLDTAAELIRKMAGGEVAAGCIDENPGKMVPREISIRPSRASLVLGHRFSAEQVFSFLDSLGFKCKKESEDSIHCTVPLFRHDITLEVDLVEEVGRMYGYDNIPPSVAASVSLYNALPSVERITDKIRHSLSYFGLNEVVTNSMCSATIRELLTPEKEPVKILNPLNPEMALMRTTLAGSMLEVIAYNLNRKNQSNHFYEIGKVFEVTGSGQIVEHDVLGIAVEGNYWGASWNTPALKNDFYVLKGILDAFTSHLGVDSFNFSPCSQGCRILEGEAAVLDNGLIKGTAGRVSEGVCSYFDIKSTVYYAELDITALINTSIKEPVYSPLPKFPALERDFSFVLPEQISAQAVTEEISRVSPLVEQVVPFDLFRGEKLGAGRKSITFGVKLRSSEKTLTEKEAEGVCSSIVSAVEAKFGAHLRT